MSSPFKLYDQKGRPFVRTPGAISYYKNSNGKLLRVPSMFGPKEQITKYIQTCFEKDIGLSLRPEIKEEQIVEYLGDFWERGENTTVKILEMLDRRTQELKNSKSIRSLIYSEVAKIVRKLTVPIFNRQQLENIPNMSRAIIDEIDLILKEARVA